MHQRKFLPLLLSALLATTSGCSQQTDEPRDIGEWRDIGATSEMRFYVSSTVEAGSKADSPFVGIKTLWDFNQPQKRDEGIFQSTVFMVLIDCDHNLGSDFSYTHYSAKMATGVVVATGARDIKEAEKDLREISNPAMKAVAEYVCQIKKAGRLMRPLS